MALVAQLLPNEVLGRLNESQLAIVTSVIDSEILVNASVRKALAPRLKEILRTMDIRGK